MIRAGQFVQVQREDVVNYLLVPFSSPRLPNSTLHYTPEDAITKIKTATQIGIIFPPSLPIPQITRVPHHNIKSMNHARQPRQDREQDVDKKMRVTSPLQEDRHRGEEDGHDEEDDVTSCET